VNFDHMFEMTVVCRNRPKTFAFACCSVYADCDCDSSGSKVAEVISHNLDAKSAQQPPAGALDDPGYDRGPWRH